MSFIVFCILLTFIDSIIFLKFYNFITRLRQIDFIFS